MHWLKSIVGPRVPDTPPGLSRWRYVLPTVLLIIAAAILLASFTQPYWQMTLHAPQYPKGLHVHAYLNGLEGDVREIDILNHYIGMRPLEEAAQLERSLAFMMVIVMSTLLLAAVMIHTKWAALLALPAVLFPAGFLVDLQLWLYFFGQNLDPTAALSSSVKPFTPWVLGESTVGNFRTTARGDVGLYMACIASGFVLAGLYFHRRAYKPLVDAQRRATRNEAPRGRFAMAPAGVASALRCERSAQHSPPRGSVTSTVPSIPFLCASAVVAAYALSTSVNAAAPGTPAAPFDLASAIASADEGSTIAVPPGVYRGPVVIDRSLTLDGGGRAVIDSGGEGDVVRIIAPDVTLRGFTIRNSGANLDRENSGILALAPRATIENNRVVDALFGISLKSSRDSVIRGNTVIGKDIYIARRGDGIRLWDAHNALIENNIVRESRDVVMWYSNDVHLRGNRISHSRYGLHFMYSHDNVLEDNILEENSVGAFLMYSRNIVVRRNIFARNRGPSGYGLGVKDMQGMIVEDNIFVGNCVGAYIDNPPVFLPEYDRFTRNAFAYNDIGIALQPSVRRVAVFENSFIENHVQVTIWGGGELRGNHFTGGPHERGNYWSDYRGFDLDGDGIGDLPYQAENLWDSLMSREPSLRLFMFSPAQQAVELASRAFPMVKPRPLFVDEAPLMRPVRADVTIAASTSGGATWLLAGGLLGIACLAIAGGRAQTATKAGGAES